LNLPFTVEEFFEIFRQYNTSVFPAQIFLNLLAVILIISSLKKTTLFSKYISIGLGLLLLWMGIVYHFLFFSKINPAANVFALAFVLQGIIFFYFGAYKGKLFFAFRNDWISVTGTVLIIYALIVYPILGILFDRTYPANPTFGLPCPTTIFTFGILLWTIQKVPIYLIMIPFLWSIIGLSAAINIKVYEDFGLIIAALIGTAGIILNNKKVKIIG
jgi:hypothetical protein